MKNNPAKKKVDPAVSEHFAKLGKESWKARKKRILASTGKVGSKTVTKK